MISVAEVVTDPDMIAPQPFTILRSTGMFVIGGFQSFTTSISAFGPVQQASDKEVAMLDQADRIGGVRSFWWTQEIFTTRGKATVPGVHGEAPTQVDVTHYTLSAFPPDGVINVYASGLQLRAGADYVLTGVTLVLTSAPISHPYVTWQVGVQVGQAASDILQYDDEQYRVLNVYLDPGGGYWKALATRMDAA